MAEHFPPPAEHADLMRAALRVINADHYAREDDAHADAESEYASEQLAHAARAYTRAVDALPEREQPIGWTDGASALTAPFDFAAVIHDLGDDGRCAPDCSGCDVEPTPKPRLDAAGVGSVSPTDPDELGPWLLQLPHRAILCGADGYPYQRGTGFETTHRAPDREYPALIALGGAPLELTEGCNDVRGLAECAAPFTVLSLGDGTAEQR